MKTTEVYPYILAELAYSKARWPTYHSTHEGLGVLTEEYHELVEAIRSNDPGRVALEAIQVAAVAIRIAEVCEGASEFVEGYQRARAGREATS